MTDFSADQLALRERLAAHVHQLADVIGERHVWRPQTLDRSASFLLRQLSSVGCTTHLHEFTARGCAVGNVEGILPGRHRRKPILVVGAHYDSVQGCPGANDNASGCAALIEIARAVAARNPGLTIRFVAFVNEEPPFFQTGEMGSLRYARQCRAAGDGILGMFSLETIGYYSDEPDSQRYPVPLHAWYPTTGHFIGFVSNVRSARFLRRAVAAYRRRARVPAESAALPAIVPGVGWSDHWAFWECGYPAVMVTDTAPYRYPHYHTAADTPDKIDFDRFTLAVEALADMVAELAEARG